MRGAGNPNWKGGATAAEGERNKGAHHTAWRLAVFQRDKFRCRLCSEVPNRGNQLRAHHVVEWSDAPLLRFVIENGATLCEPCHRLGHCRGMAICLPSVVNQRKRDVLLMGSGIALVGTTRRMSDAAWRGVEELAIRMTAAGALPAPMSKWEAERASH